MVLVDSVRNEFSRKDIVLYLADKEGGAHVDKSIDEAYDNLRRKNALGWVHVLGDGRQIAGEDHVPATMRQIGHEVIKSLDPSYTRMPLMGPDVQLVTRSMMVKEGTFTAEQLKHQMGLPNLRKDRPKVNGVKIGRNDPCICGSGIKYKHCCI